ncbi:hypothetical protein FQA47_016261 [Oryzias melastigma]|uniref:Uncharacterized protein n=1 Tax=Oryzias melastigma TaxID=30732 RepID=A0A834C7I2_ORYME|nr:hypothetical protein FQA47_016261 [Oryzias melastigma]
MTPERIMSSSGYQTEQQREEDRERPSPPALWPHPKPAAAESGRERGADSGTRVLPPASRRKTQPRKTPPPSVRPSYRPLLAINRAGDVQPSAPPSSSCRQHSGGRRAVSRPSLLRSKRSKWLCCFTEDARAPLSRR